MNTISVSTSTVVETKSPTWASTTSILHLLIASSQAKGKLKKNRKVLQGTKGMQTQAQVPATMDYSSLALNFSYIFNVSKAISRHMEGQETSESDPHQGKLQKNLAFCTHPDVRGFRGQTHVYTR